MTVLIWLLPGLAVAAGGLALTYAGCRAGDVPGDVRVLAALATAQQPDGSQPVVEVTVRNPGPDPVLVGLTVRAAWLPAWLRGGASVSVPRRTTRPGLRADRQDVVGVASPWTSTCWLLPVPQRARHCRVVAAAGQAGGRLRVITLPVPRHPRPPQADRPLPRIGAPQP